MDLHLAVCCFSLIAIIFNSEIFSEFVIKFEKQALYFKYSNYKTFHILSVNKIYVDMSRLL